MGKAEHSTEIIRRVHIEIQTIYAIAFATSGMQNEWSWRLPSASQALPSVLQLQAIHFYPELPTWVALLLGMRGMQGVRLI